MKLGISVTKATALFKKIHDSLERLVEMIGQSTIRTTQMNVIRNP